mgnify:CR=1 FL=1
MMIGFANFLKNLKIKACFIEEAQFETIFIDIDLLVSKFPNLEGLELNGMRIGEHLGELVKIGKRPNLKHLELGLNGIEPEYCLYFENIINFETLETFDISNNWIGYIGIERMKDFFINFKRLKVLNFSSNKLLTDNLRRTEDLRDMIRNVSNTLVELHLHENSMVDEDLIILTPAIAKIKNLKILDISKNRMTGNTFRNMLDVYIENSLINGL